MSAGEFDRAAVVGKLQRGTLPVSKRRDEHGKFRRPADYPERAAIEVHRRASGYLQVRDAPKRRRPGQHHVPRRPPVVLCEIPSQPGKSAGALQGSVVVGGYVGVDVAGDVQVPSLQTDTLCAHREAVEHVDPAAVDVQPPTGRGEGFAEARGPSLDHDISVEHGHRSVAVPRPSCDEDSAPAHQHLSVRVPRAALDGDGRVARHARIVEPHDDVAVAGPPTSAHHANPA